ncbi:MAG: hypothetical protein IPL53_17055 [Ignavibacteria bacterium]|nr:hypothetical protein [Ignavibacteria bacterium]
MMYSGKRKRSAQVIVTYLPGCAAMNIECASIIGFVKTPNDKEEKLPEKFTGPNHQWSAVLIYGRWYLLDVTWDAGYS